jgi:hypothetical protein
VVNVLGLGRLGIFAVGLGIGVAVAHSPVASADDLDFQISFDGQDLLPTADNGATAYTVAGEYGLAIAYGAGSQAYAIGGTSDYALADGTGAYAFAGAPTGSGSNFDSAVDVGNGLTGVYDGSVADYGSNDTAIQIGNNTGPQEGVFVSEGNGDTAIQIGNNSGDIEGPSAEDGNDDTAIQIGNNTGPEDGPFAGNGSHDVADVFMNNGGAYSGGFPSDAPSNYDTAYVLDPFGPEGSFADAGGNASSPGGNDLAAVLGVDDSDANAVGSNLLYDIVTALGHETGTAAATSGGWLTELLSLF